MAKSLQLPQLYMQVSLPIRLIHHHRAVPIPPLLPTIQLHQHNPLKLHLSSIHSLLRVAAYNHALVRPVDLEVPRSQSSYRDRGGGVQWGLWETVGKV